MKAAPTTTTEAGVFEVGLGPSNNPGHVTVVFTVQAKSERAAFRQVAAEHGHGLCIYSVVKVGD